MATAPVHPKVKAAAGGAALGTVLAELVEQGIEHVFYHGHTAPEVVVGFVFLAVPAALAFAAGYVKKATS